MRLWMLFVSFVLCGGVLIAQSQSSEDRVLTEPKSISSPTNAAARPIPIEDLYYTRSLTNASWSPDAQQIVFSCDMTGRLNLWKVPSAGGWPIQLTASDDRQYAATWSPDGKWIAYQQDIGGNELWDVFAIPSDGGEVINLTKSPDIREEAPRWSPDGNTIAVNYKRKEATAYDIALIDWKTQTLKKLTNESAPNFWWSSVAWSPDGKTLFANRTEVSFTDSDIYAIEVATGKSTNLTAHQGKMLYVGTSLSPDGKTLLLYSTEKGGFQNVALLDVAGKKTKWITDTKWEATSGDFSPDGKSFTYAINADGGQSIYLADAATTKSEKIQIPGGWNAFVTTSNGFSPKGAQLLIGHESPGQPADFWIYNIGQRKAHQLTYSSIASLNSTPIAPAQMIHYKSFDGKTISALLLVPFNLKRDGTNPALVLPHGGPTGQVQQYFSARTAAFVSRGYICIAPNVRGSTGYGMDFQKANFQDLGGGDLQDEVYATKFLLATGYVDSNKIGITGGSYGGYMTLMAIGKKPEIWAAAVDLYGIIDWYSMLKHEDPSLQEYEKMLLGDPEKDRKVYEDASPIKYIHNVKAPLLVLQGENDPRVPKEESEQVINLLKKDGKTVDVHYYPNEGHGFEKRENQIDSIHRTIDWLDKYLKK